MSKKKSIRKAKADGAAPKNSAGGTRPGNAPKTVPPPKAVGRRNTLSSDPNKGKGDKPTGAPNREQWATKMTAEMQARERDQGECSIVCWQQPQHLTINSDREVQHGTVKEAP